MACVDYTGAKIMNLSMTTADGRDKVVEGPVSFQAFRRLVLRSLSMSALFDNFNVFKSPPANRNGQNYKKYEFCGKYGEVEPVYMYNVNANEVMREVARSMSMNFGSNFAVQIKLKSGEIVHIRHNVSKLWFAIQQASLTA
jgi:hypothetical protein